MILARFPTNRILFLQALGDVNTKAFSYEYWSVHVIWFMSYIYFVYFETFTLEILQIMSKKTEMQFDLQLILILFQSNHSFNSYRTLQHSIEHYIFGDL